MNHVIKMCIDVPFSTPYFCVGVFTQSLSRHCEVFGMGVESPVCKTNCSKTGRDISKKTLHFLESGISEHSANPPIRWAWLKVFIYDFSSVVISTHSSNSRQVASERATWATENPQ